MQPSVEPSLDLTISERAMEAARTAVEKSTLVGLDPAARALLAIHGLRTQISGLVRTFEFVLPEDLLGEPANAESVSQEPQILPPDIQAAVFMYLLQGKVVSAVETVVQADRVAHSGKFDAGTGVYLAEAAGQQVVIVTDPELRNEILKTKNLRLNVTRDPRVGAIVGHPSSLSTDPDTELWSQLRRITEDHIGRGALPRHDEAMREAGIDLFESLKEGDIVDPFALGREFAVATMSNLLIGENHSEEVQTLKGLLTECLSIIEEQGPRYLVSPISQIKDEAEKDNMTQKVYPLLRKAFDTIEKVIQRLIDIERKAIDQGEPSDSFITALLNAGIDETIIRNQFRTLALAGTATTAATIGWLLYSLGQNPEAFEKLRDEVSEFIDTNGGIDNITEIDSGEPDGPIVPQDSETSLPYARAAIKETLLHYNPAAMMSRVVTKDFEAGGYRFHAGQTIIFDTHVSTLHAFAKPLPFDPERFLEGLSENEAQTYRPFGDGPSKCSGRRFGNKQALWLITALVNSGIKLEPTGTTEISGEATMNPKDPCRMRVRS